MEDKMIAMVQDVVKTKMWKPVNPEVVLQKMLQTFPQKIRCGTAKKNENGNYLRSELSVCFIDFPHVTFIIAKNMDDKHYYFEIK